MVATRATRASAARPAADRRRAAVPAAAAKRSHPAAAAKRSQQRSSKVAAAAAVVTSAEPTAWYEGLYSGGMSAEYKRYMATEWGWPKRGESALFEKMCLEGAQAGLSWSTILSKREAYREAFHNFDVERCAAMGEADVERLLSGGSGSGGIVRHRGKVSSVLRNARCVLALRAELGAAGSRPDWATHGALDELLWSFVGGAPQLNAWASRAQIPSTSPLGDAMSRELKRRGFSFVGPTMCYSLMQSCGLVIDHPKGTPEWHEASRRLQPPAK